MSITNYQQSSETDECDHPDCTTEYTPVKGVDGHCSPECAQRHRGHRLLKLLKHDHRFCYTCFRQLKEIDRPPETAPDCVTGFQYRTAHGELGQVAERRDAYRFETKTGTICECGNANTQRREDMLREADIRTVVLQLHRALTAFRREGQHDKRVDIHVLISELREQARRGNDWDFPRAVGAAIEQEADQDA
jgi:hypothetical protein